MPLFTLQSYELHNRNVLLKALDKLADALTLLKSVAKLPPNYQMAKISFRNSKDL